MSDYSHALGRVLLSVVFIVFGFLQATNIGTYIANPAIIKFSATIGGILSPTILAWLLVAIDLIGGLCILTGFQTRWVSIVLIIFIILTLFYVHNFWTMEGPARVGNMVNFYKNLAMIGALLMLLSNGPGKYSIDAKMAKS